MIISYGFGVEVSSMENSENPFVKNAIRLLSTESLVNPMIALGRELKVYEFFISSCVKIFLKQIVDIFRVSIINRCELSFLVAFPNILGYFTMFPSDAHDFFVKAVSDIVKVRKESLGAGSKKDYVDIILEAIDEVYDPQIP